jgi:hypothetical protein
MSDVVTLLKILGVFAVPIGCGVLTGAAVLWLIEQVWPNFDNAVPRLSLLVMLFSFIGGMFIGIYFISLVAD